MEAELAQVKRELAGEKDKDAWKVVIGSFANDPAYDKAMKLGRQYRESLRPKETKRPKKTKKRKRSHGDS